MLVKAAVTSILSTDVGSFTYGTIQPPNAYSLSSGHSHPQQSTGPSPSDAPFEYIGAAAHRQRSEAFCFDLVSEYYSPIRLLAPHRLEFRLRLYPHLPPGGCRSMFVFPVSHPFVCECHKISTIPSARTIPGLPGSLTSLPHRVVRTHLGTMDWNPDAFAPIVRARPLPIFGRPVHLRDGSH
jgi:hypothetical protein